MVESSKALVRVEGAFTEFHKYDLGDGGVDDTKTCFSACGVGLSMTNVEFGDLGRHDTTLCYYAYTTVGAR